MHKWSSIHHEFFIFLVLGLCLQTLLFVDYVHCIKIKEEMGAMYDWSINGWYFFILYLRSSCSNDHLYILFVLDISKIIQHVKHSKNLELNSSSLFRSFDVVPNIPPQYFEGYQDLKSYISFFFLIF